MCSAVFAVLAEIWLLMVMLLNSSLFAVLADVTCWQVDDVCVYNTSVGGQVLGVE